MNKSAVLASGLCIALSSLAQIPHGAFDTGDFPNVTFPVRTNNPDTLAKADIHIYENGTPVELSDFEVLHVEDKTSKSNVLIIGTPKGRDQQAMYVINDLLTGYTVLPVNENMRLNAAVYRRSENKEMEFQTLQDSFSSDVTSLWQSVLDYCDSDRADFAETPDILWVIDKGLRLMDTLPPDEAKAIVLFTTGSVEHIADATPLLDRAREKRVHIYTVNIDGGEKGDIIGRTLSRYTYGKFLNMDFNEADSRAKLRDQGMRDAKDNLVRTEASPFLFDEVYTLNRWLQELPQRWDGVNYKISFVSNLDRLGKTVPVKVELGQEIINIEYDVPAITAGIWIKAHIWLFIILLITALTLLAATLIFLVKFIRKRAHAREKAETARENERKRLRAEQESLRRKLEIAENERWRMQQHEAERERESRRKEQLSSISQLMAAKNIRARVLVSTVDGSYEYLVSSPEATIGTANDNLIVVNDPTVSRHHAIITYDGHSFSIKDLKSTNGLELNGFRIDALTLKNGDTISLGNTTIKVYI